ncbi:unnamed protein product [Linum tenue]|uniref:guanylate kinase n=2 Tax=Linum tenue TaxID=586396 RepID=A0AAV0P7K7_9ROSI|nr:unnamed protein product [Linum tenue]
MFRGLSISFSFSRAPSLSSPLFLHRQPSAVPRRPLIRRKSKPFPSNSTQVRCFTPTPRMGETWKPKPTIPVIEKATKPELFRALESALGSSFSADPISPPPNPLIIVISGPSGVGKDAVIGKLRESRGENLHFVVTATSRPMRPGEVHGKDYYFVSKEEFLDMKDRNELLEYALVYGDYKGIPKSQIREFMGRGCDIVLRVDIQGAHTLRKKLKDSAVFIFLVAESEAKLVERLIDRKTESKEDLLVRIATAREEVRHVKSFDYVVVNSDGKLDEAVKLVESIIDAEKARVRRKCAAI